MRVKLIVSLCGPELALAPGDHHDFDDDEALRLIAAGIAEEATVESGAQRVERLRDELAEAEAALGGAKAAKAKKA